MRVKVEYVTKLNHTLSEGLKIELQKGRRYSKLKR